MTSVETPFPVHASDGDETALVQPVAAGWFWGQMWHRHKYILPSFVISLGVCAWLVTWASWKFFEPEEFCSFYDAQALSILDGRLDVPPAAIGSEAFVFHGKAYGYFGIGPALLRIPLVVAFEKMDGRWSRMMMMIACTINLICAYQILRLIRISRRVNTPTQRVLHSLFILCAGIGSTNVFLVGRSFAYHEAIMWGSAFALLFTWTILKYLARPSCPLLTLAGFFAFMSFHCRPTAGAGALLGMCLLSAILIWRAMTRSQAAQSLLAFRTVAKPSRHALVAALVVFVTLGTYFGVNYAKFRTFNGVPLQYYAFYKLIPIRMKITGGKQLHLENIPTALATYFGLHGVSLHPQFPWFFLCRRAALVGSPAIDMVDGFSSFPVSMPALTLLAVAACLPLVRGSSEMIRRGRLPALTLLIGGAIMLTTVGITERYLHDLYPALIIGAAIGVSRIESERHARSRTIVIAVLSVISVALNCSFSLVHQRTTTGAPLAKQAEFKHLQESAERLFHSRP